MTGLQFLNASDGWAVGTSYDYDTDAPRQGWVLHTTDGGKTWARLPGLDDSLATTVHFSDAERRLAGRPERRLRHDRRRGDLAAVAGGYGVEAITATDAAARLGASATASWSRRSTASGDTAAPVTLDDTTTAAGIASR